MESNEIYIVKRANERVTLPDKQSATNLVIALTILGCSDALSTQKIVGNKQELETFEVSFLDKHINVVSKHDTEKVADWMLTFGCKKIVIEKVSDASEES